MACRLWWLLLGQGLSWLLTRTAAQWRPILKCERGPPPPTSTPYCSGHPSLLEVWFLLPGLLLRTPCWPCSVKPPTPRPHLTLAGRVLQMFTASTGRQQRPQQVGWGTMEDLAEDQAGCCTWTV